MRDVPRQNQYVYKLAMTGRSRTAAIKAFCSECVGYVFKEINLCTDKDCPLYPYRNVNITTGGQLYEYTKPKPVESMILFDPISKVE